MSSVEDAEVLSVEPAPTAPTVERELAPKTNAPTQVCGFNDKQINKLSKALGLNAPAEQIRRAFFQLFPDLPDDFVYDDNGVDRLVKIQNARRETINRYKRDQVEVDIITHEFATSVALILKDLRVGAQEIAHLLTQALALLEGVDVLKLNKKLKELCK